MLGLTHFDPLDTQREVVGRPLQRHMGTHAPLGHDVPHTVAAGRVGHGEAAGRVGRAAAAGRACPRGRGRYPGCYGGPRRDPDESHTVAAGHEGHGEAAGHLALQQHHETHCSFLLGNHEESHFDFDFGGKLLRLELGSVQLGVVSGMGQLWAE